MSEGGDEMAKKVAQMKEDLNELFKKIVIKRNNDGSVVIDKKIARQYEILCGKYIRLLQQWK